MDKSLDELIAAEQPQAPTYRSGKQGSLSGPRQGGRKGVAAKQPLQKAPPSSVFERLGAAAVPQAGGRGAGKGGRGIPPPDYVCNICHNPGHWIQDCGLAIKPNVGGRGGLRFGNAAPPMGYLCKICNVPGHWIQDCPNKDILSRNQQAEPAQSLGFGRGGRGGGGRGGRGGRGVTQQHLQMQRNRVIRKEGQDIVVLLYDTEVVRVSGHDITLNSGGYMNEVTMECINEAISKYGFSVKAASQGWQVSDGKFRLLRFFDGMLIEGGAAPPPQPSAAPSGGGAVRATSRLGAQRFAPY